MTKARAMFLGTVGIVAMVAAIFGGIAPPPFLGGSGLLICGLLFLVGLALMIGGIALHHKSKITTVTIALGKQAENDAAALTKMEFAVERGENAEDVVPEVRKEKLVVPPEVFATLNQEQEQFAKKKEPGKKNGKESTPQLSSEILRAAKKKVSKKKK